MNSFTIVQGVSFDLLVKKFLSRISFTFSLKKNDSNYLFYKISFCHVLSVQDVVYLQDKKYGWKTN